MSLARWGLLTLAGASAWISSGTFAVVNASTERVGTLPPVWLLAALVGLSAAVAWRVRPRASSLAPLALTLLLWLPWLPVHLPAAFLIWSGPAELFVWAAALGGVAASAVRPWRSGKHVRWLADPRRAPAAALLIGVVCAIVGARAMGQRIPAGDEPHYLIIAQSLLLDGDLQIENNHQRRDYQLYFADLPRPDFLRRGVNGQIYSVHAPGLPALVAPAFAIGGYPGVRLFLSVLVALGAALAWHAAWLLTRSAGAAWVGWAAVFFTAPVFFHVFTIYPDGAGAALAMTAMWLLVRIEVDPAPVARRTLAGVGAALSLLPWLHSRFAVVAAALGLVLLGRILQRPDRWRNAIVFLALPAIAAAAWLGFFYTIYGTFSPAAPYGNVVQNRWATLQPGLPGMLFDQQFGLVTNAPIFAVAAVGLVGLARQRPRLAIELALVAIPYVLAVASFVMWWAGHSAPARFLTILALPAVIPVAWTFYAAKPWARGAIAAAMLVGAFGVVVRTAVDGGLLAYNDRGGYDLLLDWVAPSVNLPLALPSFHRDVVPDGLADVGRWGLVLATAFVLLRVVLPRARTRGGAWAIGAGVWLVAAMVAATWTWARYGPERVVTPATSQLTFLRQWNPVWHPLEVKLEPFAVLTRADVLPQLMLETSNRGPQPGANRPLLYVPLLPAGEYELVVTGSARPSGTLEVSVGRASETLERFDLTDKATGFTGLDLRLPVLVHSVTIRGDEAAMATVSRVLLRPLSVRAPAERLSDAYARRASRYGGARVFFLDEYPFMESPGFWTAGGGSTTVVVDTDAGSRPSLVVRAGAVPTTVSLIAGAWRAEYDLDAGEARTVPLPEPAAPRALSIHSSAAFTPAKIDPSSSDLRELGVWVEFRH